MNFRKGINSLPEKTDLLGSVYRDRETRFHVHLMYCANGLFFFFSFFFLNTFFGFAHGRQTYLGQGLNLQYSSDQSHSSDNTRSLTC